MGLFLAITIITLWLSHLIWCLTVVDLQWDSAWTYVHVAVQAYLGTGLFITAHDAIHGTVVRNKRGNAAIGWVCSLLFAGLWYPRLRANHHLHHAHPAHDVDDPDYHPSSSFVPWFASFMWRYATVGQIVIMGGSYNVMAHLLNIPQPKLWVFWIAPCLMASFQLFFVGTFLPHRKPHTHDMPHNARSMRIGHVRAMLACYFFGYHTEHHVSPGTPWWQLWRVKERGIS